MKKLVASIIKEIRIIFRDRDALLVLFAMPLAFVLIMSLALQNVFKQESGAIIFRGVVLDLDRGTVGKAVVKGVSGIRNIDMKTAEGDDETAMAKDIAGGRYDFGIVIPRGTSQAAAKERRKDQQPLPLRLIVDPALRADHRGLIVSVVNQVLLGVELKLVADRIREITSALPFAVPAAARVSAPEGRIFAELKPESAESEQAELPSAVQQSVPGYSLFAMFLIAIPLSIAFIKERQEGSLVRILSMPVPGWIILLGKAIPFFLINQAQLVLMLFAGMYIVPMLGGDALSLGNSPGALAVLAWSASFAAVSYGIMISTFCKSVEQATSFGGASVLIFGALGGIMVPKFEMPPYMQKVTIVSPLSWGLDGFLDVFVRNGSVHTVLPKAAALLVFSLVCSSIAAWRFRSILKRS